MSKIFYWLKISFALFFINCSSANDTKEKSFASDNPKKIKITFTVDDTLVDISNEFDFFIINKLDTIEAKVAKDSILLSNPLVGNNLEVLFKYKSFELHFDSISSKMLYPNQNITWDFGIDNPPFNEVRGILPYKESKNAVDIKQLTYLVLNPEDYGDGIKFVNQVR